MPRMLYRYRCSFCHTVAASTLRITHESPLKCALCLRIMAFLLATEIDDAEWQDRNSRPIEFTSPFAVASVPPALREKKCARQGCHVWKPRRDMLNGRFCSEECGAADSLEVAAALDRVERLYQEMPWLRPKEIA